MAKRRNFGYALCILLVCALPVWGQVLPTPTVEPVPLPGGDILPPLLISSSLALDLFLTVSTLIHTASPISAAWPPWVTPTAWPPTTLTTLTRSSPISASIRETTSEPSRLSAEEGQPQRGPTARSSRYELTSGSPVRGPQ